MPVPDARAPRRFSLPEQLPLLGLALLALAVFGRTAYRTITWWDSSSYSFAAVTLGVPSPPGSLLLTLAGALATRLPVALPAAFILNLLAAAFATVTVALVYCCGLRLLRLAEPADTSSPHSQGILIRWAVALGALSLGVSERFWEYATQFTPYILTTVMTGLILWCLLRWWAVADSDRGWHWLPLLCFLIGVDFSIHRTNALLLPGIFCWIALRQPRLLVAPRVLIGGLAGLLAGLALHLLTIPMAAAHPALNMMDPSSWARFRDYASFSGPGGTWLTFFPRNAAFWSVQVMDMVRAFGASVLRSDGPGWIALAPMLFGLLGWSRLWRHDRRLAWAFAALLFTHAAATVLFFNIPDNFFRSLQRHYLPVFVTWGVLVACGMGASVAWLYRMRGGFARWIPAVGTAMLAVMPAVMLIGTWPVVDQSKTASAKDYGTNLLAGLPRDAILLTTGDNDSFPAWYLQAAERLRPDVQIINLPMTDTTWYLEGLRQADPSLPLDRWRTNFTHRYLPGERVATIPVHGTSAAFGLSDTLALPAAVTFRATSRGIYDQFLMDLLADNQWRRPICIVAHGETLAPWLAPYLRLDGIFWRVVPYRDPPVDSTILRRNLLETYRYSGYADAGVTLDPVASDFGLAYVRAMQTLTAAEARERH